MGLSAQRAKLVGLYHEYPRPFWTLLAVTFIDRLGGFLLFPFFALYITRRFGVGMTEVGELMAAFSLSSFVGSYLGGALTDRIGRKGMVIFSLVSTSISSLIMGLVGSMHTFFVLALLVGVFTDSGGPAHNAIVADLLPEGKRAQGYGLLRVAFNVSAAIGPALGGFIAARSYLMLFVADACISLITAFIVFFALPETRPADRPGAPAESVGATFAGYLSVFKDRVFLFFLGGNLLMVLVYMNMTTTLGVYLRNVHLVPESGYGLILSLNAVMVVFLQFPITRRIEHYSPMRMMAIGTLFITVGFTLYGFVGAFGLFMLAMVIITIGEMITAPVSQALTARLAPEDKRGRYMAVFGTSWGLPYAVGPYLAGLVLDNLNPNLLWYGSGVIGMLATTVFLRLQRVVRLAPAQEEVPPPAPAAVD